MSGTGDLTRTRRELDAAWRSFVEEGTLSDRLRPEIRRSWQRVRARWQVDPGLRTCPGAAGGDGRARPQAEWMVPIASRVASHFAQRMAPGGHVVALFDREGVMLTVDGNSRTRDRLTDVNFAPGACWAENTAGTNGPGTALAEARPVEIFAAEHFVEAWQPWTCASAPVRFCGRVIAAVDITSPWNARDASLLCTAEAIARTIESELEADAARRQSAALIRIAREALLASDEFVSVASHELKTPLTPLRLKIQRVQRLLGPAGGRVDPDQLARILCGADRHVERLVGFIDDLLDASRGAQQPLRRLVEGTDVSR